MPRDPMRKVAEGIEGLQLVEGALTDTLSVSAAVNGVDAVVHLAALMGRSDTPIDQYFDINLMGTLRLLQAACYEGSSISKFVYASTDSVYDIYRPASEPFYEKDRAHPGNYYGTSKVLSEVLIENLCSHFELPFTILRYGSVIGGDEVLQLFRRDFITKILKQTDEGQKGLRWPLLASTNEPARLVEEMAGTGSENPCVAIYDQHRKPWAVHFTDVRDVVQGTILALEAEVANNEIFNICGPKTTTFDEGAAIVSQALALPTFHVELPELWNFAISNDKAIELLGYNPEWTMEKMVADAVLTKMAS